MTLIYKDILSTLAYFDMLNYPLTRVEIFLFLQNKHHQHQCDTALHYMVTKQYVYKFADVYSLKNDISILNYHQSLKTKIAKQIKAAYQISDQLIHCPYVRGIAILNPLLNNNDAETTEINFFIITAKNRLWVARTMILCFKKLFFIFSEQPRFCTNYYVDEQHIQIAEKNIYTATQVATLYPLQGDTCFQLYFKTNSWINTFLPNNYLRLCTAKAIKTNWLKLLSETLLDNKFGTLVNNVLMKFNCSLLKNKKNINTKAGQHYLIPDMTTFQKNILTNYTNRVASFLNGIEPNSTFY